MKKVRIVNSPKVTKVMFTHNGEEYVIPEEYSALVPDDEIVAIGFDREPVFEECE